VILAVKPQVILDVVPAYARYGGTATYLSVAAGTPVAALQSRLGADAAIVRCMPNTPAAIGKGMMVVFANRNVTEEAKSFVMELLATSGAVATIDREELMDAVTAVSGSGPAYVFHFVEALAVAAMRQGLEPGPAMYLARQTVIGAAALMEADPQSVTVLRENVTSPNGTTAAALAVLMGEGGLEDLLDRTVAAARRRSEELGRG